MYGVGDGAGNQADEHGSSETCGSHSTQGALVSFSEPIQVLLDRIRDEVVGLQQRMRDSLASHSDRLAQLEAENEALRSEVDELSQLVAEQDERMAVLLAERTRQRTDLTTDAAVDHLQNAENYRNLVEQQLHALVRQYLPGDKGSRLRPRKVAETVGEICKGLFLSGELSSERIARSFGVSNDPKVCTHIEEIVNRSQLIREIVEDSSGQHSWVYDFFPGAKIDRTLQEVWPTCRATYPCDFVVAPGYVVDGHLYRPQLVYTAKRRAT